MGTWPDAPNGAEESLFRAAVTWVATGSGWVIAVRHLEQTAISPALYRGVRGG